MSPKDLLKLKETLKENYNKSPPFIFNDFQKEISQMILSALKRGNGKNFMSEKRTLRK